MFNIFYEENINCKMSRSRIKLVYDMLMIIHGQNGSENISGKMIKQSIAKNSTS